MRERDSGPQRSERTAYTRTAYTALKCVVHVLSIEVRKFRWIALSRAHSLYLINKYQRVFCSSLFKTLYNFARHCTNIRAPEKKNKTKEEKTLFMFITKLLFSYNSAKILMYVQLSILHMQRKERVSQSWKQNHIRRDDHKIFSAPDEHLAT